MVGGPGFEPGASRSRTVSVLCPPVSRRLPRCPPELKLPLLGVRLCPPTSPWCRESVPRLCPGCAPASASRDGGRADFVGKPAMDCRGGDRFLGLVWSAVIGWRLQTTKEVFDRLVTPIQSGHWLPSFRASPYGSISYLFPSSLLGKRRGRAFSAASRRRSHHLLRAQDVRLILR